MQSIVIVKLGSTFPELIQRQGDFDQWIRRGLGLSDSRVTICDVRAGEQLPSPQSCEGAILTGAREMVTDKQPWSESTAQWTRRLVDNQTPILGICFGHQLLAHACGASVDNNPNGCETGTARIRLTDAGKDDPLLGTLPANFIAQCSHSQSVIQLPEGAVRLAENSHDANHAFRIGPCAWGVQFHPEFSAEVTAYCRWRSRGKPGPDLPVLHAPHAAQLLGRFAHLAQSL